MIGALGVNGQADSALNLFLKMRSVKGLDIGSISYLAVMNALSHCGKYEDASNVFAECKVNKKCNEKIYAAMIDCFARCGQMDIAWQIFGEYECAYADPNQRLFAHHILLSMMSGCRKYNDSKNAHKIFSKIKAN